MLLSIPFLLYAINSGDIVEVYKDGKFKQRVVDAGGFTYRVALNTCDNHEYHMSARDHLIDELKKLRVSYEQMNILLISVYAADRSEAVKLENKLIELQNNGTIQGYDTTR